MNLRNLSFFLATLLACCALVFTACSNNDAKDIYTLSIPNATKSAKSSTKKVMHDIHMDTSPFTHWTKGEEVEVYFHDGNIANDNTHIGTLTAQDNSTSVVLKGMIDFTGYNLDSLMALYKSVPLILSTTPNVDFTQQDGSLATLTKHYAHLWNDVSITGINHDTQELQYEARSSDFYNCGGMTRYVLRDINGTPLKASRLTISCTANAQKVLTLHESLMTHSCQQGDLDITLAYPSDTIYVWMDTSAITLEGFQFHITAIVNNEPYTASYTTPNFFDEENAHVELVMGKQKK